MKLSFLFISLLIVAVCVSAEMQVKERPLKQSIEVILTPFERALLASQVQSRAEKITKKMGDRFVADEPLIIFDPTVPMANQKKAEAILERGRVLLDVRERLYKDKVASKLELAEAQASVGVAQAEKMIAENDIKNSVIKASFNGEVEEVYLREGETAMVGQKVISVFNDEILIAKMLLPFNFSKNVKIGDKIQVWVNETNKPVDATITSMSALLDSASSTFKVFAEINNKNQALKAGMTGVLVISVPVPFVNLSPALLKGMKEVRRENEPYDMNEEVYFLKIQIPEAKSSKNHDVPLQVEIEVPAEREEAYYLTFPASVLRDNEGVHASR